MTGFDSFCNDSQGFGPINAFNNDLTPCAQGLIVIAPLCLIMIIWGIVQLIVVCRLYIVYIVHAYIMYVTCIFQKCSSNMCKQINHITYTQIYE